MDLLMRSEREGRWPDLVAFVSVVLLPKPDGGFRPIGLFPTLIRVWMRLRRDMVDNWEKDNQRSFLYAGRQRGAHIAAWTQSARAEAATQGGATFAQLLLDLAKCFEVVPHDILVAEAGAVGYPLPLLRLSIAAYRLPRALAVNGVYSSMVVARRGITAGSGTATTELRVLLIRLLDRIATRFPQAVLNVFVDDMSVEATGTQHSVVAVVAAAGKALCDGLVALRLKLSEGKCQCSANSASVGHRVAAALSEFGVRYSARVKSLGVGMASGARRNVKVQASRFRTFAARLRNYAKLQRSRVATARIIRTGGKATMTYGDDVAGVSDAALLSRRRAVAAAVSTSTHGRDLELALILTDSTEKQHIDPAYDAHLLPIGRWAEAVYMAWCPLPLLRASVARAIARLSGAARPWGKVHGPAAAAVASAHRLRWTVRGATVFVTDRGRILDLTLDPPAVVRKEVAEAVTRWRWARVADQHPHLARHPDAHVSQCNGACAPLAHAPAAIGPIRRLLSAAARTAQWTVAHQAALRSAVVNTQWPQTRLHSAGLADTTECQLCKAAGIVHAGANSHSLLAEAPSGTLIHRLTACRPTFEQAARAFPSASKGLAAIRDRLRRAIGLDRDSPVDPPRIVPDPSWTHALPPPRDPTSSDPHSAPPCPHNSAVANTTTSSSHWGPQHPRLDAWHDEVPSKARRADIQAGASDAAWARCASAGAISHALVPLPVVPAADLTDEGTFHWHGDPPTDSVLATFYTDGSLLDADLPGCARLGWAFVAVDGSGNTVAAASGVPPPWIDSITGAEAWALLMAARSASHGSAYRTDSLNCVDTVRKGAAWALAPQRPLARVWRAALRLFDASDGGASIVWMPAHTEISDVGHKRLSDGSTLTAIDRQSNDTADALAKAAAATMRVPVALRAEVATTLHTTHCLAQCLGRTTHAANHNPNPPHRDSTPTTCHHRSPDEPSSRQSPSRVLADRPPALGGHDLFQCGALWSCRTCWATTRTKKVLASARCTGPATERWGAREEVLRCAGASDGPRHARIMTDGVIWCVRCGLYAISHAIGLARPCAGYTTSDGTRACRNNIAAFKHPRTKQPLQPPHFPEPGHARRALASPMVFSKWGARILGSMWADTEAAAAFNHQRPLATPPPHYHSATATVHATSVTPPTDRSSTHTHTPLSPPPPPFATASRKRLRGKQHPLAVAHDQVAPRSDNAQSNIGSAPASPTRDIAVPALAGRSRCETQPARPHILRPTRVQSSSGDVPCLLQDPSEVLPTHASIANGVADAGCAQFVCVQKDRNGAHGFSPVAQPWRKRPAAAVSRDQLLRELRSRINDVVVESATGNGHNHVAGAHAPPTPSVAVASCMLPRSTGNTIQSGCPSLRKRPPAVFERSQLLRRLGRVLANSERCFMGCINDYTDSKRRELLF